MRATGAPLLGIDIGGTTTSIIRGDSFGAIVASTEIPTVRTESAEAFVARIVAAAHDAAPDETTETGGARGGRIEAVAVGVAVGGPIDVRRGVVIGAPHLPHLDGFPLADRLGGAFHRPIRIHHDAAACALAEYRWGLDAGSPGLAYLTCGTGFGVGLVLDGHVRYGSDGFAPEIGHVRYRADGPEIFGKAGCFEGYGSANAIALLAAREDARSVGRSPADVVAAARAGEPHAIAACRANVEAVGAACALLADLLALDVIALGSLASYLGDPWVDDVRAVFVREALSHHVDRCRLRAAMPDVQARSALAAAVDALAGDAARPARMPRA